MNKYPISIKAGCEHHYITQELVDRFTSLIYTDEVFHRLAEDYARKRVAELFQEYNEGNLVDPNEIEESLGRPISETDLGCDMYYEWFRGLITAYFGQSSPYPVGSDRYVQVVLPCDPTEGGAPTLEA